MDPILYCDFLNAFDCVLIVYMDQILYVDAIKVFDSDLAYTQLGSTIALWFHQVFWQCSMI